MPCLRRRRGAAASRRTTRSHLAKLRIPEQNPRVKDGHSTHGESSFRKKLWCVLIVLLLGGIGWQVWKLNAYNNAVREAEEAGFTWTCTAPLSLIRQDWRNALKKKTWGEQKRVLWMKEVPNLGRYREMLQRLRPTALYAVGCNEQNVEILKGLPELRHLTLCNGSELQNPGILKSLVGLQSLSFFECHWLQNVDALKELSGLRNLNFTGCNVPTVAFYELRAALPKTLITACDGPLYKRPQY